MLEIKNEIEVLMVVSNETSLQQILGISQVKRTEQLPILDGVKPFLANLKMWSLTSSDDAFSQVATLRRYGRADLEIPLLQTHHKKIQSVNTMCK